MKRDEVLRLAIEADLVEPRDISNDVCGLPESYVDSLVAFAELIAAHEREACAKVCEAQQNMAVMRHPARIEVEQSTQNMMALKCAGLIRARGQ